MEHHTEKASLILTCFNEQENIGQLLNDVLQQTSKPCEMVIIDAGSTDGTIDELEKYRATFSAAGIELRVHIQPKAGIAQGRNMAIDLAKAPIIAVTDAGCRIDPNWLKNICLPILRGEADFVGGFYLPVSHTPLQEAVACLTTAPRPSKHFMPSSRSVAFRKCVWQRAGKYPEWLQWGEDTLFNKNCFDTGARYVVAHNAIVHWEVRRTWQAIAKQYWRYAYGDGLARRLTWSLAASPLIYATSVLASLIASPLWLLLIPAYAISWPLRRGIFSPTKLIYAAGVSGTIQAARGLGFIKGCWQRIRNNR